MSMMEEFESSTKNHTMKESENRQAVEDMVSNSNRILLNIKSVFPWDFFPSSIVVEETRVTIIRRQFYSSQIRSVDIKNISNVFINLGVLFARLTIVSDTFVRNQIDIGHLWKKDAILMRKIIEGMRLFIDKDIDTTSYSTEELVQKLTELSTSDII